MKRWPLLILLIPLVVWAVDGPLNIEHPAEVIGVTEPDEIIGVTGLAGGASYDWTETFETSEYDNSWSENGTTINGDYSTSPAPLDGSYSLLIDSTSGSINVTTATFTAADEVYVYFMLRPVNMGTGLIFAIRNDSTILCFIAYGDDGGFDEFKIGENEDFGEGYTDFNGVSTSTTYHVWLEFVKGTGTNGTCEGFVSTTTTKGSADVSITGVSYEAGDTADRLRIHSEAANDSIIDKVIRHSSAIGSSP